MSARFNDRVPPTTRAWAPRTADLDHLSTSDIREDPTSDLAAVRTQDVHRPEAREERAEPRVFTPLVQPASALTSDLEPNAEAESQRIEGAPRATAASTAPQRAPSSSRLIQSSPETGEPKRASGISPGAILKDRYLIERALGAGGTAWVFRARDLSTHKDAPGARIAIKTPRPDVKDPARAIARLQHEFRHVQALAHPNVARVMELHSDDQTWFMTMELIEGRSLATLLREPTSLPLALKRAILMSCGQALAYAHSKGVVHGDFKPANVLVSSSGQVKVFDFGAATSRSGEETRIPAGTPAYASPEVLSGVTPDARDDVFSFACVAYELLAGQHPFDRRSSLEAREQGKSPSRISILPAPEWLALLSALAWDREERPSDIEKLAKMLAAGTASTTQSAMAPADETRSASSSDEPREIRPAPNEELTPQRSWGFFAFLACALGLIFLGRQHQTEEQAGTGGSHEPSAQHAEAPIATAQLPAGIMAAPMTDSTRSNGRGLDAALGFEANERTSVASNVDEPSAPAVERARAQRRAPTPVSEISFESPNIATSESSLAAVFIIRRSEPLDHRVQIRWRAISGTAEAGVDFASDAMGIVEFREGQTQRAIYVPLRNDAMKEDEETFTVELEMIRGGRLSGGSAHATILDDD